MVTGQHCTVCEIVVIMVIICNYSFCVLQTQRPFCSLWFCSAGVLRASEPKTAVRCVTKTDTCLPDRESFREGAPVLILVDPYSTRFFPRDEEEVKVRKWWRAGVPQTSHNPSPALSSRSRTALQICWRPDGITREEQGQCSEWRAPHTSGSKIHIHEQVLPRTCSSRQHLQFIRYANYLQRWNAKKAESI